MESGEGMAANYIYLKVYNALRSRIEQGELAPGERLETEMELRKQFSVSRETVRRALAMLESEGYIVRKVSSGTFVKTLKTEYAPSCFHESFTEQMRKLGRKPSSDIKSIEMLTELPPAIAEALELGAEERVYCIKRVRMGDGVPMAYEIAYIRQKLCPNLHTLLLDDTSLYCLYEEHYHLNMDKIALRIEAVTAEPHLQKLLNLKGAVALLKMTSVMHLTDGMPLYYVVSYHVGDMYEFTTTMPRKP